VSELCKTCGRPVRWYDTGSGVGWTAHDHGGAGCRTIDVEAHKAAQADTARLHLADAETPEES
jgi:hypothetical protein